MSISDMIFRALTGTGGGPDNFGAMVNELVQFRDTTGMSRRAQARLTGIPETTLRRWENGVDPKAQEARIGQLRSAYRNVIASPAAVARWRSDGMSVHVSGVPTKGGSHRTKSLDLDAGKLKIRSGTGDRVVDAFLKGDDGAAARAFVAGIGDPWYRDTMFRSWVADDNDDLGGEGADVDSDYEVTASAT